MLSTASCQRTTMLRLVRRMLHLPDHETKLNITPKLFIINALINSRVIDGLHLSIGKTSLLRLGQEEGQRFLANATSILEVWYPCSSLSSSIATNLSWYCVYLVSCCPALLPDEMMHGARAYVRPLRRMRRMPLPNRATPLPAITCSAQHQRMVIRS